MCRAEGQKRHQNLAPVLVIISGNSLVFSRKIITSTGAAPRDAPASVVVKKQFFHIIAKRFRALCWVRAASGRFLGEQFISNSSGFKMGFCQ